MPPPPKVNPSPKVVQKMIPIYSLRADGPLADWTRSLRFEKVFCGSVQGLSKWWLLLQTGTFEIDKRVDGHGLLGCLPHSSISLRSCIMEREMTLRISMNDAHQTPERQPLMTIRLSPMQASMPMALGVDNVKTLFACFSAWHQQPNQATGRSVYDQVGKGIGNPSQVVVSPLVFLPTGFLSIFFLLTGFLSILFPWL